MGWLHRDSHLNFNNKYMSQTLFLYARKSTDVEDKQVLSIEAQLAELRAFATREGITIRDELIEKQSARLPGRPIFDEMIKRIEKGEANGILSWHPDRLARNPVDGGRVIYLVDTGKIQALKFPTLWFENTPQGKFMLNIAFGQSKYYIDSLSENVKRGLRQKLRRGEYPACAPVGYLNDLRAKTIMVDRKRSVAIRRAFELYAENESCLEDVAKFLEKQGITSCYGLPLRKDRISYILSNPFYIGLFRYGKELYEGKHEPIVTKQVFDRVQEVLKERSRPRERPKNEPKPLCGLLRCGTCNMMVTGECRIKRQQNGNVHTYMYYHCSKRNKAMTCLEPHIRDGELDKQLSALLEGFVLPVEWADGLKTMLEADKGKAMSEGTKIRHETETKLKELEAKLQRLLDSHLNQDIEREVYLKKKSELLSEKKSLEEKIAQIERGLIAWFEPLQKWIKKAENLPKLIKSGGGGEKKVVVGEIFGSNLRLSMKKVVVTNQEQSPLSPDSIDDSSHITQWAALSAARSMASEKPLSFVVVGREGFEPSKAYASRFTVCPV